MVTTTNLVRCKNLGLNSINHIAKLLNQHGAILVPNDTHLTLILYQEN